MGSLSLLVVVIVVVVAMVGGAVVEGGTGAVEVVRDVEASE